MLLKGNIKKRAKGVVLESRLKKVDLIKEAKLALTTIAKMDKGEFVSMEVYIKIKLQKF